MPLEYDLSDKLKDILRNLAKRDPKKVLIINKKIKQIVNSDEYTIEHYKNLRHTMKDFKRVHIDKHFVLTFQYDKAKKFVLFADYDHHDNIY
ncbi:MAG: addiction module toxin RelE [Candidatus Diapherotrites archaeon]|nr:addiction module toxin RelE [Candidatus Diapherotrites archaeon]